MILSYDAYVETVEEKKEQEDELEVMKSQISLISDAQRELTSILKNPRKLIEILQKD